MKTFIDTPDDIHPADRIGWVKGYNQCLTDHEYMDTVAHLRALLACSLEALKNYKGILSNPFYLASEVRGSLVVGNKAIERIEEVLK